MSVRPEIFSVPSPTLAGTAGELVSVSISVEAKLLESLLDALAQVGFPINPQLFHNVAIERVLSNGVRELEPVTIVEFPAYAGNLDEVRQCLSERGFDPASIRVRSMLEEMHSQTVT